MISLFRFVWNHPLNSNQRWAAIRRVLCWQLASRLMAGPIAFPFVEASKLFAVRGMTGATGNWYCGLHEVEDMAFVLHALQENEHFLDVGANIGSYTVLAAAGPKARVTAVEPIPNTFHKLQDNVALNQMEQRVRACCIGLSNEPGLLRFSAGLDTVNHVLAPDENLPGVDVPVMRLDDLVDGDCPVVIKIDVEGHELRALQGSGRTLANPKLLAVVMETNGSGARYGWSDDELLTLMGGHGFAPYNYDPFTRELMPVKPGSANTIFVRDQEKLMRRVKQARRFKVGNSMI
jgi:FkbM family methyltransferase